ncbi:MAG: hypothetical protein ACE5FT_02470 [Candidatus Nanoarchaeia archaeon]
MKIKNDVEIEDWILLLVGAVAVFGLLANGGLTTMALYKADYFGPEYTDSGYYGRRKMELRGVSSDDGFAAADECVKKSGVQNKVQCCRESCGYDDLCAETCERLVSQQSYQKSNEPEAGNIYQ